MRWNLSKNEEWTVGLAIAFMAMLIHWFVPEALAWWLIAIPILAFAEFVYWADNWRNSYGEPKENIEETFEKWATTLVLKVFCVLIGVMMISIAVLCAFILEEFWDWLRKVITGQEGWILLGLGVLVFWLYLNTFRWNAPKVETETKDETTKAKPKKAKKR